MCRIYTAGRFHATRLLIAGSRREENGQPFVRELKRPVDAAAKSEVVCLRLASRPYACLCMPHTQDCTDATAHTGGSRDCCKPRRGQLGDSINFRGRYSVSSPALQILERQHEKYGDRENLMSRDPGLHAKLHRCDCLRDSARNRNAVVD